MAVAAHENPPGADEFLPVLIYVTIKATPSQLNSNLLYIQRYRRQSRVVSETAYYFRNILSAASFITNIDAQSLSMDEVEFERNMESARALLSGLTSDVENSTNVENTSKLKPMEYNQQALTSNEKDSTQIQTSAESFATKSYSNEGSHMKDQSPITKSMSISDLVEKGANVILKEDDLNNVFREFPYVFSGVGDLTLRDVEDLLNNYKQLVFKYVCLAKGLGVVPSPSPISRAQAHSKVETMEGSTPERVGKNEHNAGKHNGSDESSEPEMGISSSNVPQDDAVTSLKREESSEVLVPPPGDAEAAMGEVASEAPSSEHKTRDAAPSTEE